VTVRAKETGRVDYNLAKQIDEEWGHYATLVFIEKIGAVEKLCLRAPKSLIWHRFPTFSVPWTLLTIWRKAVDPLDKTS